MDSAPRIDWALARRVAALAPGDLPALERRDLERLVADLRVTARRAGQIGGRFLGLDSAGATRIKVVDWQGWGAAVRRMGESTIAQLGLGPARTGALAALKGAGNGLLLGAGLRVVSRRLLGQYDAYTGDDTLYLVAPTIVLHERRFGFDPADFRLWVALHEQTHALQFRAAPWLRDHLRSRIELVLADEAPLSKGLAAFARTGDGSALVATGEAGEAFREVTTAMTFLEGHADHTADTAGRSHIRTVPALRRAFTRPEGTSLLARLSLDKAAQYRDGLEFCRHVARLRGPRALRAAFEGPDALPRADEIADPRAWVDRVHG